MRDAHSKLIRRAYQSDNQQQSLVTDICTLTVQGLESSEEMFTRSSPKVQGRYAKLLRELKGAALKGRTCGCSRDPPQEVVMTEEMKFLIRIYLISIALLTLEQLNKTRKENTQRSHRTKPTCVRT